MSSGFLESVKKDYKNELSVITAQITEIVNSQNIDEAILYGLQFEKKCRLGSDTSTLKEICLFLIELCFKQLNFDKLNNTLLLINKKRNQSRHVITGIVEKAMLYLLEIDNIETKTQLIKTLMEICDGKS